MVYIGVNISERKSGTERTKKQKKLEFVFFPTTRGRNWYCSTSSWTLHKFCPSYDNPGYLYPEHGPDTARTKSKQAKHTQFDHFAERISLADHWKLVAESSEFHSVLSRAYSSFGLIYLCEKWLWLNHRLPNLKRPCIEFGVV